jgi:hypothetical protein
MKSFYLYIILWVGGCLIASVITVLWNDGAKSDDTILFGDKDIVVNVSDGSSNIVNELLISAKELNISGSTLVSPGYKSNPQDEQLLTSANKKNTEQVYNAILKRKLEIVTRQNTSHGFAIKPVPGKN